MILSSVPLYLSIRHSPLQYYELLLVQTGKLSMSRIVGEGPGWTLGHPTASCGLLVLPQEDLAVPTLSTWLVPDAPVLVHWIGVTISWQPKAVWVRVCVCMHTYVCIHMPLCNVVHVCVVLCVCMCIAPWPTYQMEQHWFILLQKTQKMSHYYISTSFTEHSAFPFAALLMLSTKMLFSCKPILLVL